MIRRYKEIKKDDEIIVVQEMTIEEIVMLSPLCDKILEIEEDISDKQVIQFIQENFDLFKGVLKRCVKPDISKIGLSYLLDIIEAFWEVNKSFFVRLAGAITHLKEN